MRVRNDRGALATQAIIAGVLSFVMVSDAGGRAAGAGPQGVDGYVFHAVLGALAYTALLFGLHMLARARNLGGRWLYVGIGTVSAAATTALQTRFTTWSELAQRGVLTPYLAMPLAFGAIMGFVYAWRAGLEAEGDDPAMLETALGDRESAAPSGDGSFVDTGAAEYFDGPLQVRTVAPVAFVAALISSGAFGLIRMAFGVRWELGQQKVYGVASPWADAVGQAAKAQLYNLPLAVVAAVPLAMLVLLAHLSLRAMGRTSYGAYALAGACLPFLPVLFMGLPGVLVGLMTLVPGVLAMCTYRSMAGVEPKQVKEDILVRDRRHLVGEAHPRRRFGRLVKG